MEVPEVKRLKSFEEENARLKKLFAAAHYVRATHSSPRKGAVNLTFSY